MPMSFAPSPRPRRCAPPICWQTTACRRHRRARRGLRCCSPGRACQRGRGCWPSSAKGPRMGERSLIFPAREYRLRIARLQAGMTAQGLDALLLTTPADLFYVTGFLTRFWESPARPWFVVVPQAGDPVAVIPSIGADLMGRTWVRDIRTWDAPDPRDDGTSLLVEALTASVPAHGRIGLPKGLET